MTDSEMIRRLNNVRRRLSHNTEDDMKNDEALTWAIECVKHVSRYPNYVCSVIDKLLQDIESTGTTYTVDGDTVTTDVGYADIGIFFFVDHLKRRLKGEQDDDKETAGQWIEVEDKQYSGDGYWMCPVCDHRFSFGAFNLLNHYPYCPKCGRRMKGKRNDDK